MKRFITVLLVGCALVAAPQKGWAQPDSLWTQANAYYANGQIEEALQSYLAIEAQGWEDVVLYYNLGNAYFKTGQLPHAILYYERAAALDPSNADVAHNLELARESCIDKIESVPEFFVAKWFKRTVRALSSNTWAVLALVWVAVALLGLLGFYFAPPRGLRKVAFILSLLCFFFALLSYGAAWYDKRQVTHNKEAIVFAPVCEVKSAPETQGKNLFVLHEGTKVVVLETIGQYARVELLDGRQGWMALSEIKFVHLQP